MNILVILFLGLVLLAGAGMLRRGVHGGPPEAKPLDEARATTRDLGRATQRQAEDAGIGLLAWLADHFWWACLIIVVLAALAQCAGEAGPDQFQGDMLPPPPVR